MGDQDRSRSGGRGFALLGRIGALAAGADALDSGLQTALAEICAFTGWTNMSIEHTARTGADMGYYMVVPEDGCSTINADWHNAAINYALQNVATVTNCGAVLEAIGAAAPA